MKKKKSWSSLIKSITIINRCTYKNRKKIAKEALQTGKSVYDLVLEHQLLSKDKLDQILDPKNMLESHS